jgi:hypothetical protein
VDFVFDITTGARESHSQTSVDRKGEAIKLILMRIWLFVALLMATISVDVPHPKRRMGRNETPSNRTSQLKPLMPGAKWLEMLLQVADVRSGVANSDIGAAPRESTELH